MNKFVVVPYEKYQTLIKQNIPPLDIKQPHDENKNVKTQIESISDNDKNITGHGIVDTLHELPQHTDSHNKNDHLTNTPSTVQNKHQNTLPPPPGIPELAVRRRRRIKKVRHEWAANWKAFKLK